MHTVAFETTAFILLAGRFTLLEAVGCFLACFMGFWAGFFIMDADAGRFIPLVGEASLLAGIVAAFKRSMLSSKVTGGGGTAGAWSPGDATEEEATMSRFSCFSAGFTTGLSAGLSSKARAVGAGAGQLGLARSKRLCTACLGFEIMWSGSSGCDIDICWKLAISPATNGIDSKVCKGSGTICLACNNFPFFL